MGFYFFAVAIVCHRLGWKKMAYASFGFAIALGTVLGITRMAQGGHFFSDILVSALIMWLVPYLLASNFKPASPPRATERDEPYVFF